MSELAQWTEADVTALHGMGPAGVRLLRQALAAQSQSWRRGADESTHRDAS